MSPGIDTPDVEGDQVFGDADGLTVIPGSMQLRRVDDRIVVPGSRVDAR
jgi:hypothetical protein